MARKLPTLLVTVLTSSTFYSCCSYFRPNSETSTSPAQSPKPRANDQMIYATSNVPLRRISGELSKTWRVLSGTGHHQHSHRCDHVGKASPTYHLSQTQWQLLMHQMKPSTILHLSRYIPLAIIALEELLGGAD